MRDTIEPYMSLVLSCLVFCYDSVAFVMILVLDRDKSHRLLLNERGRTARLYAIKSFHHHLLCDELIAREMTQIVIPVAADCTPSLGELKLNEGRAWRGRFFWKAR
jgi:hypothetical protein